MEGVEKGQSGTHEDVKRTAHNLVAFLLEKNRRYKNSALEPEQLFGRFIRPENPAGVNQILTRLDDKVKRLRTADELRKNDVADMAGYLILLCTGMGWREFEELID